MHRLQAETGLPFVLDHLAGMHALLPAGDEAWSTLARLAQITPPLGLNLFIIKSIAPPEVTLKDILIGAWPFMILDLIGLALVIIFPQIILWLPSTMLRG